MTAETRRRWWGVGLVAGALVLLIALLPHGGSHARRAAAAPDAAARLRATAILQRWRASMRAAPAHAHDLAAPEPEAEAKLAHLSELDRTADQDQLLWTAEEGLVESCMRKRGFTYLPNPKDVDPDAYRDQPQTSRGDVEAARSRGYGLVEQIQRGDAPVTQVDRNAEALTHMTVTERNAFLEALRGPAISAADPTMQSMVVSVPLPGGGSAYWYRDSCFAQARRQLYGENFEDNEIGYSREFLRAAMLARADEDQEYKDSLETWRNCMRGQGFSEDRPASAANRLVKQYHQGRMSLNELHTQEVQIATADAQCYAKAGLERVRQAAEARAEEAVLAENRDKIADMVTERKEAIERAERILADNVP